MISQSRSRLSYKDRRSHQKKRFRFVGVVILVLLLFQFFTVFILEPWVLKTASMEPGYPIGSRLLVSPYLLRTTESALKRVPKRGDIVLVKPPYVTESLFRLKIIDPVLRMVSFQKISVIKMSREEWENDRVFKRIIAVPGDTLKIEESVVHVRAEGDSFFISEFETSGKGYDIQILDMPPGWGKDMPLSGYQDELILSEGEFFVMGDNRAASNDSRYWGPVEDSEIRGRVVFSYWPFRSFGRPN